jgi:hypothetical protein
MASKRAYVRSRLARVPLDELEEIAGRITAEFESVTLEQLLGRGGYRGVDGELKNIIFAADGPKPRIVLRDAINNVIEIVEGADRCLVYDRPLPPEGLTWRELVRWWMSHTGQSDERQSAPELYRRLRQSLESPPERLLFEVFSRRLADGQWDVPALIPQVYLHYSPYMKGELAPDAELPRQRMDFLMLPSDRQRIVIEVDGKQHYADPSGTASPSRYAKMVREDRSIRLAGYEVYRFGGAELMAPKGDRVVTDFFDRLLAGGAS